LRHNNYTRSCVFREQVLQQRRSPSWSECPLPELGWRRSAATSGFGSACTV
jgi:hypothetical protein